MIGFPFGSLRAVAITFHLLMHRLRITARPAAVLADVRDHRAACAGSLHPACPQRTRHLWKRHHRCGWATCRRLPTRTCGAKHATYPCIYIACCHAPGSGKTAAFGLPLLERLLYRNRRASAIYTLVMTPTRELAVQVRCVRSLPRVVARRRPPGMLPASLCTVGFLPRTHHAVSRRG